MYVQKASIDIYMATQNCIQNTARLKKIKVPNKSKARSLRVKHEFTETAVFIATPVKKRV